VARQTRLRLLALPALRPLPDQPSTSEATATGVRFVTTGEPAALTAAVQRWLALDQTSVQMTGLAAATVAGATR
jgi:hypothetical protein